MEEKTLLQNVTQNDVKTPMLMKAESRDDEAMRWKRDFGIISASYPEPTFHDQILASKSLTLKGQGSWMFLECWGAESACTTKSRQGNEQMRTFEPTNESVDCWSAMHSYNFIIRVK